MIFIRLILLCAIVFYAQIAHSATRGEYISLGDISLYVEQQGKGDPIIFLHGGLGSANSWADQVPFFSKNYHVITPDSRGQGRSSDSVVPLTYHLMAKDMADSTAKCITV